MKQLLCILLALCLLGGNALCESGLYDPADDWDDWEALDSRFGYTLWYPADVMSFWTEEYNGAAAEWLCPLEDESGVAAMICRGSRFSAAQWDEYTRMDPDEIDVMDIWLDYPYEVTAYTDGEVISEQWIISAPQADYVFVIEYETGDYQGWAPLFHELLSMLEFPNQPSENASFRLDYFQGGAAGMQFIPVEVDEEAEPLVLIPLEEVTGFALERVEWEDWAIESVQPLYTTDVLSPGDNLLIYAYIPDMLPDLRVRCVDARGDRQCWYISQSGRDGSLLMIPEDDL